MESKEQKIDCLEIEKEGLELEYQYIKELKEKEIENLKKELSKKEKEKDKLKQIIKELEIKLEKIEYSRWWKLRKIFKK